MKYYKKDVKIEASNLVYDMIARTKQLADQTMDDLRMLTSTSDTLTGRRQELQGYTRGDLIELILINEFLDN